MSAAVQTCTARADGYVRREPEATVLYRVVREHWPRFLERAQEEGGLPRFVVRDFEEFLRCGVLEHGVVQLACSRCGHSMVVAFSCKRRGWCPSCLGRRMADLAAHLVDEVLPEVPLRQWVCSLPWAMRCMLACAAEHRVARGSLLGIASDARVRVGTRTRGRSGRATRSAPACSRVSLRRLAFARRISDVLPRGRRAPA